MRNPISRKRNDLAFPLQRGLGETERSVLAAKRVERNPLLGERMGYHLWTWKGANTVGKHELLLYDANNRLICRRQYEIVAASP